MKTTIDMAREAGFDTHTSEVAMNIFFTEELKAFEALVRADEREAIISRLLEIGALEDGAFIEAIRARGNT
jgi:hypothetical protein